jgi:hypothetical protein
MNDNRFSVLPRSSRSYLTLTLGLLLALPHSLLAQSAPVAFKNLTDTTLDIESETITDGLGTVTPLSLRWTIKPRQYTFLNDQFGNKIYATKLNYRVQTPGKTSAWTCTLNRPDANGNFNVEFSQDNLNGHLGVVVANAAPFAPFQPTGNGPTQEQMGAAIVKIMIAAVAQKVAKDKAARPNPTFGEMLAEGFAKGVRDSAIDSALRDLFPRMTGRQARDVQFLISEILDGRLDYGNLDQQATKQRLVNDLRAANADLADAAVVADFVFGVYQASRRR